MVESILESIPQFFLQVVVLLLYQPQAEKQGGDCERIIEAGCMEGEGGKTYLPAAANSLAGSVLALFISMPLSTRVWDRLRTCLLSTAFIVVFVCLAFTRENLALALPDGTPAIAVAALALKVVAYCTVVHRLSPTEGALKAEGVGLFALSSDVSGQAGSFTSAEAWAAWFAASDVTEMDVTDGKLNGMGVNVMLMLNGLALAAGSCTLAKLDLVGNRINDECAVAVAEALKISTTLKEIDLAGSFPFTVVIGPEGANAIVEALKINKTLQNINLENNQIWCKRVTIGANNVEYQAAFEAQAGGATFDDAWANHCGKAGTIIGEEGDRTNVDVDGVGGNGLWFPTSTVTVTGASNVAAVVEALKINTTLKEINLFNNGLDLNDDDEAALKEARNGPDGGLSL